MKNIYCNNKIYTLNKYISRECIIISISYRFIVYTIQIYGSILIVIIIDILFLIIINNWITN